MMRKNRWSWGVSACAGLAMAVSASAVPLAPGDQESLSGTTSGQTSWLPGAFAAVTLIRPFTVLDNQGSPVFQGTLTSEVIRSNELGTLRFDLRIRDMQAIGNRAVSRVDAPGFTQFQTNVEYSTSGLGDVGPSAASRSVSGSQVSFFFDPLLFVSQDSRFFWVHTNATHFESNGQVRIVLNTGESVIVNNTFRPTASDCTTDTNGDGIINFTDLNAVLSEFGEVCN